MLKQLEVFMIAALFILLTAIILIIHTTEREQDFKQHNQEIQQTTVHGAAEAINRQLQNKQRHIRLFINEYSHLITQLIQYPDNEKITDNINSRLQQRFSDFFTYTLSNTQGKPLLFDIDSLVGDICQRDLKNFAHNVQKSRKSLQNTVFIHPQPYHYHYDIMIPIPINGTGMYIFFISFYTQEIANSLKTHELPGQQLMLVKQSEPTLIEITRNGSREKLSRDSHLTSEELSRISASTNIPNSDWRLISLPEPGFERTYLRKLWQEAGIILGIVTFALVILIMVLIKIAKKRKEA